LQPISKRAKIKDHPVWCYGGAMLSATVLIILLCFSDIMEGICILKVLHSDTLQCLAHAVRVAVAFS
jgi:hypothetical protein